MPENRRAVPWVDAESVPVGNKVACDWWTVLENHCSLNCFQVYFVKHSGRFYFLDAWQTAGYLVFSQRTLLALHQNKGLQILIELLMEINCDSHPAHIPIKRKGGGEERSLCHNDSLEATAHNPVHLKFIKFQFPQVPSSNNIVIQEVKEIIYPNGLYTCKCLARLVMYTVVSGSLLYLTSLYINFGQ